MTFLSIDRHVPQGQLEEAINRVKFCLDLFQKQGFKKGTGWQTTVTKRLTVEEIIGALVSAEQQLKDYADEIGSGAI